MSRPGLRRKLEVWWKNQRGYIEGRVLTAQGIRHVKQHRFFMERHLGRRLDANEDVHHINGVKTDNRIENLQVLGHAEHTRVTNSERTYRRGYKMNLTNEERAARGQRMRAMLISQGKSA